jgi:hypothetical protein
MAGRILNRRELRRQSDAAEGADPEEVADDAAGDDEEVEEDEGAAEASEEEGAEEAPPPKAKAKPKAPAKPRKPRAPKAVPRMRARWGVFDASMKQVAVFDYKDRAAADAKVVELLAAKKSGTFFLQLVKEPMTEDAAPAPAVR